MAEKKFRVDINLQGNEIKNFGIHNVDPESVVSPFEGQEVYFEGKIYYYDGEKWTENGDASDIKAVADDLSAYKTSNDAAVASKVAQSDYDTKVAELEAADTAEAEARQAVADDLSAYKTSNDAAVASKVAQSDYDTKVAELEAADTALDEAKADKATTLAGYNISDAYTKTEVDNLISGRKQVVSCPAITASGSQFTWSITNNIGADAIVSIYEGSDEVIADVNVTASTITIKFNETSALSSISAGQFKAIIMG